jgi:hypothetical protein
MVEVTDVLNPVVKQAPEIKPGDAKCTEEVSDVLNPVVK